MLFPPRNRPTTTTHYMSFIRCKFLKCVINGLHFPKMMLSVLHNHYSVLCLVLRSYNQQTFLLQGCTFQGKQLTPFIYHDVPMGECKIQQLYKKKNSSTLVHFIAIMNLTSSEYVLDQPLPSHTPFQWNTRWFQ